MAGLGLTISILADVRQLQKGLGDAGSGVELFGQKLDVGMIAKATAVGAAVGVAVDVLKDWTQAAIDDQAEQDRLAQAISSAGAAVGDWQGAVDGAIERGQALAFTDTEIRDALTPLVGATGDVSKATDLLATAQDLARLKGIDLKTASEAVAKAQNGQATQLARLVGLSAQGKSATEVLTQAQKLAAGQADAYGSSLKGQMDSAGIAFSELTEEIGAAFLPIVQALVPALRPILQAFGELVRTLLPVLTPLLQTAGQVIAKLAGFVTGAVQAISQLVRWLRDAIGAVGRFLSSIGPLRGVGDLIGNVGHALGMRAAGGGMAGLGAGGGVTVHVHGGNPQAVAAAVAQGYGTWTRTNGAGAPARSW
jgi:hypothetical protein